MEKSLTVNLKIAFFDITGDILSALMLSQLLYWFSEDKNGAPAKIKKTDKNNNSRLWVAKARKDWYKEIRVSDRQVDAINKKLRNTGFVIIENHRYNGIKVLHYAIDWPKFIKVLEGLNISQESLVPNYVRNLRP